MTLNEAISPGIIHRIIHLGRIKLDIIHIYVLAEGTGNNKIETFYDASQNKGTKLHLNMKGDSNSRIGRDKDKGLAVLEANEVTMHINGERIIKFNHN